LKSGNTQDTHAGTIDLELLTISYQDSIYNGVRVMTGVYKLEGLLRHCESDVSNGFSDAC